VLALKVPNTIFADKTRSMNTLRNYVIIKQHVYAIFIYHLGMIVTKYKILMYTIFRLNMSTTFSDVFPNVFSSEVLESIVRLPEVNNALNKVHLSGSSSTSVYFTIPLTETIRSSILSSFGLDLSSVSEIPMRWIKGDTLPHIDVGSTEFENTYFAYLTDSVGEFVLDNTSYTIQANSGFKYNEGIMHKTQNTGLEPRLLLGPMNEFAMPVGTVVFYYPSEADALSFTNILGYGSSFTVGDGGPFGPNGGYIQWRIASNSGGSSPQNVVYTNGDVLNSDGSYYFYPASVCFLEGTKILSLLENKETYVPIENLRKGDLVKTSRNGYKKIDMIGKHEIQHTASKNRLKDELYKCSPSNFPELMEDLIVTGYHNILVNEFVSEEQKQKAIEVNGKIYVTDEKYRLPACVDNRTDVFEKPGKYMIWHLALEHDNYYMNYGIYANGMLVESCSKRYLKELSNMIQLE